MHAYILCGGQGTRLRSVLRDGQKALVDVDGRPFLSIVLTQLRDAGIQHATLCAGYRSDLVEQALSQLRSLTGMQLDMVSEAAPLGTGGAILNAISVQSPEDFLMLLNADTYLEARAYQRLATCRENSLLAVPVEERSTFGSIECSASGQVLALHEKTRSGPGLINAGAYVFSTQSLAQFPMQPCSLERDILPMLIRQGNLKAVIYNGLFHDIGTPESLHAFTQAHK